MHWPRSSIMAESSRLSAVVLALVTLLYPFLVWWGMTRFEPRWLAMLLLGIALLRAWSTRQKVWWLVAALACVLAVVAWWGNTLLPIKLYPVLVSAALLIVFGLSLTFPPSIIERMARLQEPDLPPYAITYTRQVTWVWCGFFVLNGSVSALTAVYADESVWALYNGLISYLLMGLLFAVEFLVRRRMRATHE